MIRDPQRNEVLMNVTPGGLAPSELEKPRWPDPLLVMSFRTIPERRVLIADRVVPSIGDRGAVDGDVVERAVPGA